MTRIHLQHRVAAARAGAGAEGGHEAAVLHGAAGPLPEQQRSAAGLRRGPADEPILCILYLLYTPYIYIICI